MKGSISTEGSNGVATTPSSSLSGPLVVDSTLSDENTLELLPSSPVVEVVDTDACAKVRFPEEIPDRMLEAYLRHHSLGQGGTCPGVLSWCLNKFNEMYPDALRMNFEFI